MLAHRPLCNIPHPKDLGVTLHGSSDVPGLEGAREAALLTPTLMAELSLRGFTMPLLCSGKRGCFPFGKVERQEAVKPNTLNVGKNEKRSQKLL